MNKKLLKKSFKKNLSKEQKDYLKLILNYVKVSNHSYFAKDNEYYLRLLAGFYGDLDQSQKRVFKKAYGLGIPPEKVISLFTPENFKDKKMYKEIVYTFYRLLNEGETLYIKYQRVRETQYRKVVAIPFPNPDKPIKFQESVSNEFDIASGKNCIRVLNASNKYENLYLFKITSIDIFPF